MQDNAMTHRAKATSRYRQLVRGARLLSAVLGMCTMQAMAQSDFPNKPIRLVVPFTPGGVTDTSGRLMAEQLSKATLNKPWPKSTLLR